jgi:hypothetical protein
MKKNPSVVSAAIMAKAESSCNAFAQNNSV